MVLSSNSDLLLMGKLTNDISNVVHLLKKLENIIFLKFDLNIDHPTAGVFKGARVCLNKLMNVTLNVSVIVSVTVTFTVTVTVIATVAVTYQCCICRRNRRSYFH